MRNHTTGSFTLPGEAGYEKLTLDMAKKWGADVIRDSDGTKLSEEIIDAGYGIYSTVCLIRNHNEWAKENLDKLQQCFLITNPLVATSEQLIVPLMADFFMEQFSINDTDEAMSYWQVYDRTTGEEVAKENWCYDRAEASVRITKAKAWHKYTVSFMVYRIWEEISMYNHTTNNWEKDHLMQIDPMYGDTQNYLIQWMEDWCKSHQETTVVRFTSMFYNFAWIWGSDEGNRHIFSDWGSYDFTVSVKALELFREKYGYAITAEDFVNGGKYRVSHMPSEKSKLDWMSFINDFVINFGKKLIDIVHQHGKLAYVFYDDSWVGIEPYNDRFVEFGFDGMIKCVFSGFEARMCSGVEVETHEIRLHPYLFPVGLGGAPTFMDGGDPTLDAKKYWVSIRRALLREPIDRIGLGGYLHLVEGFPDFCDYIEKVSDEFRLIKGLHSQGKPYHIQPKVAVLTTWGKDRAWTLSGHFHETYMHDLIHINESLSGLPVEVEYISFEDLKEGALESVDVVINAGRAGTAWSGGKAWADSESVEVLTKWVHEGGTMIGINEPSAITGYDTYLRMAHIYGVDIDTGARVSHGKWSYETVPIEGLVPGGATLKSKENVYLTDGKAHVILENEGEIQLSSYEFGKGKGIYMSAFEMSSDNTRLLLNLITNAVGDLDNHLYLTDNLSTECAYYPNNRCLIVINNSSQCQKTKVQTDAGMEAFNLEPYETQVREI